MDKYARLLHIPSCILKMNGLLSLQTIINHNVIFYMLSDLEIWEFI